MKTKPHVRTLGAQVRHLNEVVASQNLYHQAPGESHRRRVIDAMLQDGEITVECLYTGNRFPINPGTITNGNGYEVSL